MGFDDTGYLTGGPIKIDDIQIHGFAFTYKFDGVSFTAKTELDTDSTQFSDNTDYTYLSGATNLGFLIPYAGTGRSSNCLTYTLLSEQIYSLSCVAQNRIRLWEEWIITFAGDSCCGGALKATITTWFGELQTLQWFG